MMDQLKKVEKFFLTSTLWIYVTVILLFSIILTTEKEPQSWMNYLYYVSILGLLFMPIFIFVSFRDWLRKRLKKPIYLLVWAGSFLLYPGFLGLIEIEKYFHQPNWNDGLILSIAGGLFFCELLILSNHFILSKITTSTWWRKINLEKMILILTFGLSTLIVLASNGYQQNYADQPFFKSAPFLLYMAIQQFLIFLIYYCFYLINHYFLINKLFRQRGLVFYGFGLVATIIIFYPIAAELISWMPMVQQFNIHPLHNQEIFDEPNAFIPFVGMAISIPFILAIQWFKQSSEIANLEKEKSNTELNLLKQQINPHFFFNTLNNLYALSIKKDQETPEVIMKLSELMRYVIYKGKEEKVFLHEEIKYIEDYVQLQQIRLHKKLEYSFEKEITDDKLRVPPILFIILVENAFKHGVEPAENDCFLHLYLESNSKQLKFVCENSFEEKMNANPGIGLENLIRRLELLFPDKYEFRTVENNNIFSATLSIEF